MADEKTGAEDERDAKGSGDGSDDGAKQDGSGESGKDGSSEDGSGEDESKKDGSDDEKPETEADRRKKTRRRLILIVVGIVVLILAIVGGILWYLQARKFESTDDAFVDGQIVRIAAQEDGKLVELGVDNNARVVRGDILARIDPSMLDAQLAMRQAELLQARAALAQSKAALDEALADVDSARSEAEGAEVTAVNERARADRFAEISDDTGQLAVSTQELDDTVAGADEAEASASTALTAIVTAQTRVAAARTQVDAAEAGVRAADANVAATQVDVDRLTIVAPIDGQVVQRNVNIGSYVSPGTQLMALVPDDLYVTANFKETQLGLIRPGQTVDVAVDAFPDVDFKGKVVSIQNGAGQAFQLLPAQNATGNFVKVVQRVPVRISIESPDIADYPIGPGMSVVPTVRVRD